MYDADCGSEILEAEPDFYPFPKAAYRFKIEAMFREMKRYIGGLFYHFWTNVVPRLERYRRKDVDAHSSE